MLIFKKNSLLIFYGRGLKGRAGCRQTEVQTDRQTISVSYAKGIGEQTNRSTDKLATQSEHVQTLNSEREPRPRHRAVRQTPGAYVMNVDHRRSGQGKYDGFNGPQECPFSTSLCKLYSAQPVIGINVFPNAIFLYLFLFVHRSPVCLPVYLSLSLSLSVSLFA